MQLAVRLGSVRLEKSAEFVSNSDPYVEVSVGSQRQQTKVFEAESEETSDELLFTVKSEDVICLTVRDREEFSFAFLGKIEIEVADVLRACGRLRGVYPFQSNNGSGALWLEIVLSPQQTPTFPGQSRHLERSASPPNNNRQAPNPFLEDDSEEQLSQSAITYPNYENKFPLQLLYQSVELRQRQQFSAIAPTKTLANSSANSGRSQLAANRPPRFSRFPLSASQIIESLTFKAQKICSKAGFKAGGRQSPLSARFRAYP